MIEAFEAQANAAQAPQATQSPITMLFDGEQMRTITVGEAIWFCAMDIGRVLTISQSIRNTLANFDADEKGVYPIHTPNGMQNLTFLSEAGLYRLVLRSDKYTDPVVGPKIRRFQKWVTGEVLPALRKNGAYSMVKAQAASVSRIELAQWVIDLEKEKAAMLPMVEAYQDLISSDGLCLLREAVKAIPGAPGQNRAWEILRSRGVIIPETTEPYQQYIDKGFFVRRPKTFRDQKTDELKTSYTTMVTPKGIDFLRKVLAMGEIVRMHDRADA